MGALLQGCGRICWHQRAIQAKAVDVLEHSEEEKSRRDVGPSLHASETSWGSSAYEKLALFPDFGGSSPQCPPPPKRQTSGPITLDVLQGDWYAGNGSQISVFGTAVYLNGLEMRAHRVELDEDGSVVSIGRLWQVHGWGLDGAVEFRAASSRENMEFAPKEVWTRRDAAEPWLERMRLMGYAGTAADPLNRGVEGCIPGTLAQDMPSSNDAADVELLSALIIQWREPGLQPVRCCHVIPDFVNREGTGVGVELVHFIALSMKEHGFKKRRGKEGHDIPVVVREPPASAFYEEALLAWKEKAAADEGFPPVRVSAGEEMFTSLGNGHFFQALNLYDCQCNMINCEGKYVVGEDAHLAEAIAWGVPSIVLHHNTPRTVRAKIAHLLNAKREYHWALQEDGTVDLTRPPEEDLSYCKQFECMSKFLDAVQVNSLVRTHLGIRDSKRAQG